MALEVVFLKDKALAVYLSLAVLGVQSEDLGGERSSGTGKKLHRMQG